jgi:cytochrome b pre-mRNA-processing protein 3
MLLARNAIVLISLARAVARRSCSPNIRFDAARATLPGFQPPWRKKKSDMLGRLIATLTGRDAREQPLWSAAVAEARRPAWFRSAGIPENMDGRFTVLASVVALVVVRLEQFGGDGEAVSVGLTERFVESMDAELRQLGIGDPGLGKQVRAMVGALALRVERWRAAVQDEALWSAAAVRSLFRDAPPSPEAQRAGEDALSELWQRLQSRTLAELRGGTL